ncbi:cytochrome P450 [Aspergillus bertholletiae]|uniref:Cytochrome P450 n=1 Tax=Aspergillus bertholletiae TaxID=1226010 RepID=A0A5N7AWW5_9EURO|nr:cytochrome P450 [Aspergillus bertholletiae]
MAWIAYLSALVAIGIFVRSLIARREDSKLSHIPLVKFDENDTQERYITSTRDILHQGYLKYGKHGQAFRMRNPVDGGHSQVIMAKSYLDEVKNASESRLSFPLYSIQSFLLKYSRSVLPSPIAAHVTRIDLNKNLGELVAPMREECIDTFKTVIPECKDWAPLKLWDVFLPMISRMTGRMLVGEELCRNPEWIQLTIANTQGIMKSSMGIRALYSSRWQWLAPWTYPGRKDLVTLRRRAAELIEPVYMQRLAAFRGGTQHKYRDAVQWIIENSPEKPLSPAEVADALLFLYMAGIHSTSATIVSIVYDLIAHPEYVPALLDEIRHTLAESPEWSRQSLAKLRKLDSFMKESQRLNPVGCVTVQRSTVRPYTFADGLHLPANTFLSFPTYEFTHDAETYPNPDEFDGLRFHRMREEGDATKFHFATVSNDSTNFGAGFHACPGRFFVAHELKIILTELLMKFELVFAEGTRRPPDHCHDFTIMPNMQAEVRVREKQSFGI